MDKELSGKPPRKWGRRERFKDGGTRSSRDLAILQMIAQHGGGPVKTAQVDVLFWKKDVIRRLAAWGLDRQTVARLRELYADVYLGQRVEQAKLVAKLAQTDPEQLASLPPLWQEVRSLEPGEWLLRLIEREDEAPALLAHLVRHPSEFVSSAAKSALRAMVEAGLLTVDELPVRRRSGSGQYLYYLTAKGRRWLAQELGVAIKDVPYRRPGQLSDFKLLHHLQCVDLSVSVRLSCQRLGYRLVQELTDEQLKQLLEPHQVTYRMRRDPADPDSVATWQGMSVPDYFFIVEAQGRLFAHLVEVDRGTITVRSGKPGLRDFKRRVLILSELYKSRLYHQLFPQAGNSFRYLVITNGGVDARGVHDRVQSLKTVAEEAVAEVSDSQRESRQACQRYWFAHWSVVKPSVTDYFSAQTILDGPWWFQAGDDQPRALIW